MDPIEPMVLPRDGVTRPCGLPVGDMRGYARVRDDAALVCLSLDRVDGPVLSSHPGRPLLELDMPGKVRWLAAYVPGTNVLETTGSTDGAELRIVDFMPVAEGRAGQAEAVAEGGFVRIVTCTEGEATFRLVCSTLAHGLHRACSVPMSVGGDGATASVRLRAGESLAFMLSTSAVEDGAPLVARAWHALGDTIHYWTWWSDRCRYKGDDFDDVLRDALTLKLGCHAGQGLMVEDPGASGFAPAPLGESARAAARFLALGYRHECVELLAHVMVQGAAASCDRWTVETLVSQALSDYVQRYGTAGLPATLAALQAASVVPAASASK